MEHKIDKESSLISLHSLMEGNNHITNLSNASAILNEVLNDINWVGFYINSGKDLYLGPFQGKYACVLINYNQGVVGKTYNEKSTLIVDNVHEFPGHIACDSRSNSEICIPLFKDNEIFAILDIDSPKFSRFSKEDKLYLEEFCKILEKHL